MFQLKSREESSELAKVLSKNNLAQLHSRYQVSNLCGFFCSYGSGNL